MSLGINLLIALAKKATAILEGNFDIEVVEKHHNQKIDAPSGTAIAIADAISETLTMTPEYVYDRHSVRKKREKREIGIHSIRGGSIVGEHQVIPYARKEPSEACTETISPSNGLPCTSAMAPEKTHGWNLRRDSSLPFLNITFIILFLLSMDFSQIS